MRGQPMSVGITAEDDLAAKVADANALAAAITATKRAHERAVVDCVVTEGLQCREAGKLFGVSHDTIWRWVNKRYPGFWGR